MLRFIAFSEIAFLIFPWLHTVLYWLSVCLHNACSAVNWFLTEKYNILMFVEFVAKKASCVWDKHQLNSQVIWPSILRDNCKYLFRIISTAKAKCTQRQFWVKGKDTPQCEPMLSLFLFIQMKKVNQSCICGTVWEGCRSEVTCSSLTFALSLGVTCLRTTSAGCTGGVN